MGYHIVVGGTEVHPLATIHGWKLFKDWADILPIDSYSHVVHLAAHAWVEPAVKLASELEEATNTASTVKPTDPGVLQIAIELAQTVRYVLKVNPRAQSAFVSDGTTRTKPLRQRKRTRRQ